jgi:hypothetical protein
MAKRVYDYVDKNLITTYEFEGSGTYEGNLNRHEFKFKKAFILKQNQ